MKYIAIIFSFLFAQAVFGCSFTGDADLFKTAEENYPNYKFVLSGTISNKEGDSPEGNQYTFDIRGSHKSQVINETIIISSPGHSCGFFGSVGQHMLFFTNELGSIDEANPKYFFDSADLAYQAGRELETKPVEQPKPKPCTKEYRPVCGELVVQCVQAPCPPVQETYSNACVAENVGANVLYEGKCKTSVVSTGQVEEPTIKVDPIEAPNVTGPSPTTDPTVGFVEPVTPPPYDNSIDASFEERGTWWERLKAWITRVLSF